MPRPFSAEFAGTVRFAFTDVLSRPRDLARDASLPLAVFAMISIIGHRLAGPNPTPGYREVSALAAGGYLLLFLAMFLSMAAATGLFALTWIQSAAGQARRPDRFRRFILASLTMALFILCANLVAYPVVEALSRAGIGGPLVLLAIAGLNAVLYARLSFMPVAAALSEPHATRACWDLGRGRTLLLIATFLTVTVAANVVASCLSLVFAPASLVGGTLQAIVPLAAMAVHLSATVHVYRMSSGRSVY